MTNEHAPRPRGTVLQIQPGESVEDFITRIAETAPEPSPHLMDRIHALLSPGANG
ncbi:hypothetical protein [Streptomyces camelliae]|uniref:DUF1778 domain-containing protein n=1 Tax=Streptomyces camelliae TaxID=3004093 RepID=A0ABY7NTM1_9ACTN|nr:hypothetical protein [Streptomyces sp. HUAS 2-6]WBO61395.1 hypothetical protein O1G22_00070 [Streptomyces sp. HUAS 2-6]